jgi:glutaredoxin
MRSARSGSALQAVTRSADPTPMPKLRPIALLIALTSCLGPGTAATASALDPQALAECVADSGAVFYGAHWCPYCARQRAAFQGHAEQLRYVECSEPGERKQTAECREAGIRSYPTWELADGTRLRGLVTLEQLADATGCRP